MTRVRTVLAVATWSVVAMRAPTAMAQSAGAEALFREGRALVKAGKVAAGCDKLAASDKVESSVGTLLNLGDCREKLGQTATAWAAFRKAEAMAKRDGDDQRREAEARRRAERLEQNGLSTIILQAGASTKDLPDLALTRDGDPLDVAQLDTPVPIDPGPHTITVEAPGYKPFKTEVSVGKGATRYVVIPSLEAAPVSVAPATVASPAPTSVGEHPLDPEDEVEPTVWNDTRKAAAVVGGAGIAALGVGLFFGARSRDREDRANEICPGTLCGDAEALRLNDDAQTAARTANILFVAGGAAVGAAAIMWFVGRPEGHTVIAPAVGSDRAGATLVGRF